MSNKDNRKSGLLGNLEKMDDDTQSDRAFDNVHEEDGHTRVLEINREKQTTAPRQKVVKEAVKEPAMKKSTNSGKAGKGGKKKHNWLLWVTLVVILIPCLLMLYIIIGSHRSSNSPVEGNRFDGTLNPAITEEDRTALQSSLNMDGVESVSVNLTSATLRVIINTQDDLSEAAITDIMNTAYDTVIAKLPVETYFTNKTVGSTVSKMYDLEVEVYNIIPANDEQKASQIHMTRIKNSAAESDVTSILSSPKNEEISDGLLNPDTSTPPSSEAAQGE